MPAQNATHLFEAKAAPWPAASESFWTTLFALFLLHLSRQADHDLTIWTPHSPARGKFYAPRTRRPRLQLPALDFDDVIVEPRGFVKRWPGTQLMLSADAGGFSPDIVVWCRRADTDDHFLIVENKVTYRGCLADNQLENYPRLATRLGEQDISFDLLLLHTAGSDGALYDQARRLQAEPWGERLGMLLWEEVFEAMHRTKFAAGLLPVSGWTRYSALLPDVCGERDG